MCPWPGPAQRRGRGVSDGGRPPVGGRFRQPDRTPFFRLTPALGLRSLRKNGYVEGLVVALAPIACGGVHTTEPATSKSNTPDQRLGAKWVPGSALPCGVAWNAFPNSRDLIKLLHMQMQKHTRTRKRTRAHMR